jgi:DNA polymerase-1
MLDPVYIFDVSPYLHRAMYVSYGDRAAMVPPEDETFVKHACVMLSNTMETLGVKRMVVVADSSEPSPRCEIFPSYKAKRKAHYRVFAAQAPRFLDALRDVSIPVVSVPRYEADDLIAALAGELEHSVTIVASDKDLMALVDDAAGIRFYDPVKSLWMDDAAVREKFSVSPKQLYDYAGLVGDSSDGIPGVPGCGAKTAAKLLREFDNLDEVYREERRLALHEFASEKLVAKLLQHQESALLSRQLARPWPLQEALGLAREDLAAPPSAVVRRAMSLREADRSE